MAGQITHILAGEAAFHRAAPALADETIGAFGAFFRLGCQGPDIFYHNQRTKPSALHYGSLAHRRDYGRIVAGALEWVKAAGDRPCSPPGAYLLGMATHAAVDRATHPFIVYFSGWQTAAVPGSERFRSCHPFLERLLDVGCLAALRRQRPEDFDIDALLDTSGRESAPIDRDPLSPASGIASVDADPDLELVALWASGLRFAFPQSTRDDLLLERRIANALIDGRYFFAITNPAVTALNREREDWFAYLDDNAGYRSVALVYPEALPEGLDPLNLSQRPWRHPSGDGRSSRASYLELFEEGVSGASAAIRAVLEAFPGKVPAQSLAERIGLGGLSVTDAAGAAMAPLVSDPLPLAEVMESEYRKRLAWIKHLRELTGAPASGRIPP